MMCCPFHGDKHPSMKVDSRFHCFACQADGDVIDFVGRLFQLSPYKAVEKLKDDFGMALADGKVRLAPRRPPTVRQQLLDYYRSAALAGPIRTAVTHRRTSPLLP